MNHKAKNTPTASHTRTTHTAQSTRYALITKK